MSTKLHTGDYIFHVTKNRGHYPCVVEKIGRGGRIKVSNLGWVSAAKCVLQDEWEKEST